MRKFCLREQGPGSNQGGTGSGKAPAGSAGGKSTGWNRTPPAQKGHRLTPRKTRAHATQTALFSRNLSYFWWDLSCASHATLRNPHSGNVPYHVLCRKGREANADDLLCLYNVRAGKRKYWLFRNRAVSLFVIS